MTGSASLIAPGANYTTVSAANHISVVTANRRYDQDESGARDVSEEMDSFNMKGRGDDATLTERQVKRLSARQVRCDPDVSVRDGSAFAAAASHAMRAGAAKPRQRNVGGEQATAERCGSAHQRE
jgi:hypothetical protein